MPKKNVAAAVVKPPHFKNESDEADWLASPVGRRFLESKYREGRKKGTIYAADNSPEACRAAQQEAKRTGKLVSTKRIEFRSTDPAKLQALVDGVKADHEKRTQQIALRIPVADLAAAKRIAAESGIGYQRLLKAIIHDALQAAAPRRRRSPKS